MQTRSFSVIGPATWNGLPIDLRHLPNGACSQFHHLLKIVLFSLDAWVSPSFNPPLSFPLRSQFFGGKFHGVHSHQSHTEIRFLHHLGLPFLSSNENI